MNFAIPRPPRSAAIPLLLTFVLLVSLCLAVTSFQEIRITFIKPAAAGSLPIVGRGQEFVVEGTIDCKDNIYRQIESIELFLFADDPESPLGEALRYSTRPEFDRLSSRFLGRLRVKEDENADFLVVKVGATDHIHREYGPDRRPIAGNALKLRVQ